MDEFQLFERATGLNAEEFVREVIDSKLKKDDTRRRRRITASLIPRLVRYYIDNPSFAERIAGAGKIRDDLGRLVSKWGREVPRRKRLGRSGVGV